jgi:hypothetical protein
VNIDECAKVLAKIQLGDNRQADKATLAEWFDSIKSLRFEDAVEAVTMHRQESTEYLQPAHIHRNVRRIVADRVEAQKALMARTDVVGDPKPDNWEAMSRAYKDPVEFGRQVAIYDQQLVDAGLEPTLKDRWRR